MKSFKFKVIIASWLLCGSAMAQTGVFYSTDKDISNSLINYLYQDKRNYVWIATEDGLNKYDAVKFTIYKNNPSDTTTLKNNYVRCLYEDSKNRFWVGCINGLQLFDRAKNTFSEVKLYSATGQRIYPHITSIIESPDGSIFVSTSGEGVLKLASTKNVEFKALADLNKILPSQHLMFIFQDSRQQFWVSIENQGLCMLNSSLKNPQFFDTRRGNIRSNQVSAISEDNLGNVFLGTLSGGMLRFNNKTRQLESVLYPGSSVPLSIYSLLITKTGQVLIGTEGQGLKKYNYSSNTVEDYQMNFSFFDFSKVKVHAILEDTDGNLWTGLFQKGVYLLRNNPHHFSYIGNKSFDKNLIGSSCYTALYKDKNDAFWIGTDNDGLYQISEDRKVRHFAQNNQPNSISNTIMSVVEMPDGTMWLGSYLDGLAHFDKNSGNCTYYNEKPAEFEKNTFSNKINFMIADKNENLWIGTHGSGVYVFNTRSRTYVDHYSFPTICNDWINCLFQDNQGSIWVGTHKGYSVIEPKTGTIYNFSTTKNPISWPIIYAFCQDKSSNIWIGTTEGLAMIDSKSHKLIKRFTEKDGLAGNVICGIVEDAAGNIWLSTHNGISKYNVTDNKFFNYYNSDGLQGNEFTKGSFFKSTYDEISFGGINGVTSFFPSEIKERRKPVKLYLTALNIGDRVVFNQTKSRKKGSTERFISDLDTIYLDYKDNIFNLEFSTFNYGMSQQIYYRYIMEGLNKNWVSTNPGVNRIHFTNIKYGTYKLKVIASVNDLNSEAREITFIIRPPWYLSGWAKLLYVLLGLFMLYVAYIYVNNKIKLRNEELTRKHEEEINEAKLQYFINISHEIRTPMSLIISPLEKLIPDEKDPQKLYLYQIMHRNSKRILRLINQLMDIRKIDKGQMVIKFRETDMVGFIDDLIKTFEYAANKRNIKFGFIHDDNHLMAWIDISNMDKVIMNILSNAFKFTPDNGNITITLRKGKDETAASPLKDYFEISIKDSGIGIEEAHVERIFDRFYQIDNEYTKTKIGTGVGLHLSRSLVEMSHGVIFARNNEDEPGSEFIIRLPLGSAHLSIEEKENLTETPSETISQIMASSYQEQDMEGAVTMDVTKGKFKPKTKYHVIVVEDDDEIRNFLIHEMSQIFRVTDFRNGKEAYNKIHSVQPDLIISDIMMPEMDGVTLCRKIKSNTAINHIPVILLTAKSTDRDIADGYDVGADAYVVKPFNVELLTRQALNLIQNRRRMEIKPLEEEANKKLISPVVMKATDQAFLEKVIKLINENIADNELNVDFLARNIGMSRVHMYRKIKELTNQSAYDFIKTIRMQQASEILSKQKVNISEVAYALGYSNLSHFSNSFKDYYGLSPKEYSEKNRPVNQNNN